MKLVAAFAAASILSAARADTRATVDERVRKLTRDSSWQPVASVPMKFPAHHPQGMVKIGDTLIVSSVEVNVPTRRLTPPAGGYDGTPAKAPVTCSRSTWPAT